MSHEMMYLCFYVMQPLGVRRWIPGKQYQWNLPSEMYYCSSMTVTDAGDVVICIEKPCHGGGEYEVRWYDKEGILLHILPCPVHRRDHIRILAVMVNGEQKIALSGNWCIWLGSPGTGWVFAWQATVARMSEGREKEPTPRVMCHGKPGQIIVENELQKSVSVFDITQIPFRLIGPEIKIGMVPNNLCYCELPGISDAIAVTDGYYHRGKLGMFRLDSGICLWRVGGKTGKQGQQMKLTFGELAPRGMCSDNRGRLYVADWVNNRIMVLSATSGSVLQVVQGRGHWDDNDCNYVVDSGITMYGNDVIVTYCDDTDQNMVTSGTVLQEFKHLQLVRPVHICWNEHTKSLIVCYKLQKIIHFQLEF